LFQLNNNFERQRYEDKPDLCHNFHGLYFSVDFCRSKRISSRISKQVFAVEVWSQQSEVVDKILLSPAYKQAWASENVTRKTFKNQEVQRMALTVVQRALRRYLKLRTWPWWKLWQKVKPLLNASRVRRSVLNVSFETNSWLCLKFILVSVCYKGGIRNNLRFGKR
jgi:hypothetical protein